MVDELNISLQIVIRNQDSSPIFICYHMATSDNFGALTITVTYKASMTFKSIVKHLNNYTAKWFSSNYKLHSPIELALRASALRADVVSYPLGLLLTQSISRTTWTVPQGPIPHQSDPRSIKSIVKHLNHYTAKWFSTNYKLQGPIPHKSDPRLIINQGYRTIRCCLSVEIKIDLKQLRLKDHMFEL